MKSPRDMETNADVHAVYTQPVAEKHTLRDGLVKIIISRTCASTGELIEFALPVQWEPHEAAELIHQIKGLAWQIGDDGLPRKYAEIRDVCHNYLHEKVGYIEPINIKSRLKNYHVATRRKSQARKDN